MKRAILAVAVIALAGCGSVAYKADGTKLETPSVIYSAEYAAKAGLNKTQVDACVAEGRERLLTVGVGGSMTGGFGWLEGGKAYERCVDKTARK